jgi:quinoprotein glucose dehydrogenase
MDGLSRRTMLRTTAAGLAWSALPTTLLAQAAGGAGAAATGTAPRNTSWLGYANGLASQRYAPLDQITAANFNKLQTAWSVSSNNFGPRPDNNWQATPLLAGGRLFVTGGSRRAMLALNPATGEILWTQSLDEGARTGSRGGAEWACGYWTDGKVERVLYVTIGYQMISLDAKTGIPDPAFGKNGVVDLREDDDQVMDKVKPVIGIHAPPLIVRDLAIVGCAPTPAAKGYLRAFDVRTGKRKWIFHTIPRKGEFGADTWADQAQLDTIGNTGVWAPMSADLELGLLYAGVELPSGDEVGVMRKGDALFGETLVALDIETGERKWHFQFEHHGIWDRDIPCAAILYDMPVNGKMVKVLAQPTKQGYVFVLNRETGKPIWPVKEVKVPKGNVPGEWYSPTQPMPTKPPAFDKQGFGEDDLIDFTPELRARAVQIAKNYVMGPLWNPPVWWEEKGPWGATVMPGTQGGANWPGGSLDPDTNTMYIYSKTALETSGIGYAADGKTVVQKQLSMTKGMNDTGGGGFQINSARFGTNDAIDAPIVPGLFSIEGLPIHKPPYGRITALDLNKGSLVWQVAHGETPDVIRNHPRLKGMKIPRTGQASILGVLTTKTLVICGDGGVFTDETGRKAARLRAYDKATGAELGAVVLPKAQTGAAMTYMYEGRQYIVSAMGGSTGSDLIAFRLPAGA